MSTEGSLKTAPALLADARASVVVLLVAVPLCLGIALGSNAPLFSGIVAGIVGGIVVGLLSRSALSVSGPAAGLATIVASALATLPSFEVFLCAVVLAGLFQIGFGLLRLGVIGDYVPNSVIKGMLAAIGVTLILKQIPHLVGYDIDFEGDESFFEPGDHNTLTTLYGSLNNNTAGAILIGIVSLSILILWELPRFKRLSLTKVVPAPLVAVISGLVIDQLSGYYDPSLKLEAKHLVDLGGEGEEGLLQRLRFPDLQALAMPRVWVTAFTISLVASLESLLSIEAVDKLDPYKRITPPSRELIAQGAGNMVAGLLGGLPVTSVIVRSSANVSAGGITKRAAILHGVLLLGAVGAVPGLLMRIPLASLAAVLIFVGYKLARIELFREFVRKGWDQFVPFVVTVLAILLSDLLIGVLIGMAVGLVFMARANFRATLTEVREGDNVLIRLRKDASFLYKPVLKRRLAALPSDCLVILDIHKADFIDQDIIDTLNEFMVNARTRGITVQLRRNPNNPRHRNVG